MDDARSRGRWFREEFRIDFVNRVLEQSRFKIDGWCEDEESKGTSALDMICPLVSAQHYPAYCGHSFGKTRLARVRQVLMTQQK